MKTFTELEAPTEIINSFQLSLLMRDSATVDVITELGFLTVADWQQVDAAVSARENNYDDDLFDQINRSAAYDNVGLRKLVQ